MNYNEYLNYCKENNLNPMEEENLTKFKRIKAKEQEKSKKAKLSDILGKQLLDTEISITVGKKFKKDLEDVLNFGKFLEDFIDYIDEGLKKDSNKIHTR